jgi:hypothetical protein
MSTVLTADRVEKVFMDCLYRDGEDTSSHVAAPGINHPVGFNPERLEQHRGDVLEMLGELPEQFRKDGGGGWTFLNACEDRHGEQWTGLHMRMEQLFQLGEALGAAKCQLPREMWPALPGGVPYYVVLEFTQAIDSEAAA